MAIEISVITTLLAMRDPTGQVALTMKDLKGTTNIFTIRTIAATIGKSILIMGTTIALTTDLIFLLTAIIIIIIGTLQTMERVQITI